MVPKILIDLPVEVLRQILDHFCLARVKGNVGWAEWDTPNEADLDAIKKTLQSVRLSCRSLYHIATPLLFSVLRVGFTSKSIQAFLQLCKNPLIADNVHGVEVDLAAYSLQYAEHIRLFAEERIRELESACRALRLEMVYCADEHGDEHPTVAEYYRLRNLLNDLVDTWDEKVLGPRWGIIVDGETYTTEAFLRSGRKARPLNSENCQQYLAALVNSHQEYSRRCRDQIANSRSSEVVRSIASAITSLACSGTVRFTCHVPDTIGHYNSNRHLRDFLENPDTVLTNAMALPHMWFDLERPGNVARVDIVHLLTTLPIAVDEAGGTMRELYLESFPLRKCFSSLFPNNDIAINVSKEKLQKAYRELGRFHFETSSRTKKGSWLPLSRTDRIYMDDYIGAALSSKKLHELNLCLAPYPAFDGISVMMGCDIRGLLKQLTTTQLSYCRIIGFRGRYEEIVPLCGALGPGIRGLCIREAEIVDGSWATIIDLLRDKVATRCQQGLCQAILDTLEDENIRLTEDGAPSDDMSMTSSQEDIVCKSLRVITACQAYISGRRDQNPMIHGVPDDSEEEDVSSDSDEEDSSSYYSAESSLVDKFVAQV